MSPTMLVIVPMMLAKVYLIMVLLKWVSCRLRNVLGIIGSQIETTSLIKGDVRISKLRVCHGALVVHKTLSYNPY